MSLTNPLFTPIITHTWGNVHGIVYKFNPAKSAEKGDWIVVIEEGQVDGHVVCADAKVECDGLYVQGEESTEGPVDLLYRLKSAMNNDSWHMFNRWFGYQCLEGNETAESMSEWLSELAYLSGNAEHVSDFVRLAEYGKNHQMRDFGWD